jgi:hypothetical protein
MGAAFDEGEFGERFLGQELLVAEADEPFADLFGRKAEVGGGELLVEARVTHAGIDEDAFPGEDGEEVLLGVHGGGFRMVGFGFGLGKEGPGSLSGGRSGNPGLGRRGWWWGKV